MMPMSFAPFPFSGQGGMNGNYWSAAAQAYGYSAQAGGNTYAGAAEQAAAARACYRAIENAGIRAGEIIGWRAWQIYPDGYLRSMAMPTIWMPGQPMRGDVVSGAGVHAFKTKARALQEYSMFAAATPVVIGEVAMWGEVVEHEEGYRAEFGGIESFDEVVIHESQLERLAWMRRRKRQAEALSVLAEKYGVRVTAPAVPGLTPLS